MAGMKRFIVVLCLLAACTAHAAEKTKVVFVRPSGDDSLDGTSWANAKQTLQAAVKSALAGDQVWAAKGSYDGELELRSGVALYGGFAGTETSLEQRNWRSNYSVIDPGGGGSAVTVPKNAGRSTRIDGFTIRNGAAENGGGICCTSSSPTIANNVITHNKAGKCGGGVYCSGGNPLLTNNRISGNRAESNGGGICAASSALEACNNVVIGNRAKTGGGVFVSGSVDQASSLVNDTVASNTAHVGGGLAVSGASLSAMNNIIAQNSSGIHAASGGSCVLRSNCISNPLGVDYLGVKKGVDDIAADPKFAGGSYGDVHLEKGSPCVNAGTTDSAMQDWLDMDGEPRVRQERVDIGADEFDAARPQYVPPVVRVSPMGSDENDGSTWALARQTVQSAVTAAAESGGEVWVMAGTYYETITLEQFVHLYGGFAGKETSHSLRDWRKNETVLDGREMGSVVTVSDASYGTATIDGFTIRGGKAIEGGGIRCSYASPLITNNKITENYAIDGAGVFCRYSLADMTYNTIRSNTAGTGSGKGRGGGVFMVDCPPRDPADPPDLTVGKPAAVIEAVPIDPPGGPGKWSVASLPRPLLVSNLIAGNSSESTGGVYLQTSKPWIINNTIADNSHEGVLCKGSAPTLLCDLVHGNPIGVSADELSKPVMAWDFISGIEDALSGLTADTGAGRVSLDDPKLVTSVRGDYHLRADSPCIDAGGDSAYQPAWLDIDGQRRVIADHVDIGADESDAYRLRVVPDRTSVKVGRKIRVTITVVDPVTGLGVPGWRVDVALSNGTLASLGPAGTFTSDKEGWATTDELGNVYAAVGLDKPGSVRITASTVVEDVTISKGENLTFTDPVITVMFCIDATISTEYGDQFINGVLDTVSFLQDMEVPVKVGGVKFSDGGTNRKPPTTAIESFKEWVREFWTYGTATKEHPWEALILAAATAPGSFIALATDESSDSGMASDDVRSRLIGAHCRVFIDPARFKLIDYYQRVAVGGAIETGPGNFGTFTFRQMRMAILAAAQSSE